MRRKKLWLFISICSVLLIGGGVAAYLTFAAPSTANLIPLQHLGKAQTIENTSGQSTATIAQAGYYDITTVSGNPIDAVSRDYDIPTDGVTDVGIYYPKGQQLRLVPQAKASVKLVPAKFQKLSSPVQLKNNGGYLVGKQFPAGNYKISFTGKLQKVAMKGTNGTNEMTVFSVFLDIYMPNKFEAEADGSGNGTRDYPYGGGKSYKLTEAQSVIKVSLKAGEIVRVKKTDNITLHLESY
ncbi:MAG: hypothetical protein LBI13_05710 [Streptococcaceae bacterium]|jgi:hypothetical protein|nr:hypothetical protein [Streptococcaceae bacterium]